MIVDPEMLKAVQDEALLSDQLRIIAGERKNKLSDAEREWLRQSAYLIEDMMAKYQSMHDSIAQANHLAKAAQERALHYQAELRQRGWFPSGAPVPVSQFARFGY